MRSRLLFVLAMLASPANLDAQRLSSSQIVERVEAALPRAFALSRDLLTHPNDAHRPEDILRLLDWLETRFHERTFETRRIPTDGSPLLLAERRSAGAEQTVLIYLQADGQPVDASEWHQESPYVPVLKEP